MKEKEFNLSEKIMEWNEEEWEYMKDVKGFNAGGATEFPGFNPILPIKDVKEFIKRLKKAHMKHTKDDYFLNIINKLAGDKLVPTDKKDVGTQQEIN